MINMRLERILMCCLVFGLFVTTAAGDPSLTFTDMAGRTVTTPFDPGRILCLGPGALRLVVYLQAQEKVVAVEDMEKTKPGGRPYRHANPGFQQLPSCGPGGPAAINKKPDMEKILAAAPQVIFVTYMEAALAEEVQKALQIPVVVLSYGSFATFDETVFDALRIAGKVLNREKRADAVVAYFESLRDDLQRRTAGIPVEGEGMPGVYVGGIGFRGSQGIDSTEQKYIPFDWVHARNVAEGLPAAGGSHSFVDKETLLRLNPDIIFIDGGGMALVQDDYAQKPGYYRTLKAFADRNVYSLLPFNWYTTNVGTALADAYAIGKVLYPDAFADIDAEQKCDEIYTYLVGRPVYAAMKKDYGAIGRAVPFVK
jgi:iron complex transport system substrate-binding protein